MINADAPLAIPTYVSGNDEVVHPSVIDAGSVWNGYRYWMAATPYANTDSQYENPSIWASHDKEVWVVPDGLTNPVEAAPSSGYWSDPHLVLHDGTLYMFFRGVGISGSGGMELVELRTSTDGVTFTARSTALSVDPAVRRCLSPAVLRDADGTWRMWFVDTETDYSMMMYTATAPEGPWTYDATCQLPAPNGKKLWHFDVQARNGEYWMLLNVNNASGNGGGCLYVARSTDGRTWRRDLRPALGARGESWDASLYRACWLPGEEGVWDVWYGSATPAWMIGKTTAPFLG